MYAFLELLNPHGKFLFGEVLCLALLWQKATEGQSSLPTLPLGMRQVYLPVGRQACRRYASEGQFVILCVFVLLWL
jgi:hypothetical protein